MKIDISRFVEGTMQLPQRAGSRPRTTATNPHEQLEQQAPDEMQEQLWVRMRSLEGTEARSSAIAPPGSRAVWMTAHRSGVGQFMIGREFAHLHPRYDGSLHLVLDPEGCDVAKAAGWAERHPLAGKFAPATTVMVYGPRDATELEVVWQIVRRSHAYATGQIATLEA